MKNNETGEFELVLGNRQLLSGFFIVVILFAVFFVMGYIVGRNSAPAPQVASNREPASTSPAPTNSRPGAAGAPENPPATQTPDKDNGGTPAGSEPPQTAASQPPPAAEPKAEPKAEPPAAPSEPIPGENYLQAYSGKQDVAETVAKTLRDKGFAAVLSPGPQGKTRVLVGPYADLSKLGQAKADLERLGFSPFRQKIEK